MIWRASTPEEAIAKAEAEAYALTIDEAPSEVLGLPQSYELFDNPGTEGAEVFSLLRRSVLDSDDYLNAFLLLATNASRRPWTPRLRRSPEQHRKPTVVWLA